VVPTDTLLVNTPGTFLGKKSRRVIVKTPESDPKEFSLLKLKEITLVGSGISVSNDLILQATKLGININLLDRMGRFYAKITSPFLSQTIETARAQLKAENTEYGEKIAKGIILAKMQNQANLLKFFIKHQALYYPEKAKKINQHIASIGFLFKQLKDKELSSKKFQNILFSFEGRASDSYWLAFRLLTDEKLKFPGRVGRGA